MTIDEALAYGRSYLPHLPTSHLDARLLLQHLLNVSYSTLIAHGEQPLTTNQQAQFQHLLDRAAQHEPIPYIIGKAPFFDFDLAVSPAVLIPRPETEQLVEMVVAWAKAHQPRQLADIGTGSGCIAIALARQLPETAVIAVDISPDALAIARQNAAQLAPGRVQFHLGSLLEPLAAGLGAIVANLPYVTDAEWTTLDDGVKWYEPTLALKGGPDGLDIIQELLNQAASKLSPGGAIFLEIGWQQGAAAKALAQSTFPHTAVTLLPDWAGHDRFILIGS